MKNDLLSSLILTHWRNYQPTMLAQFKKENRLEAELEATANQFSDLIHQLVVIEKMSYPAAWEIAVEQFLLPEEEQNQDPDRAVVPLQADWRLW